MTLCKQIVDYFEILEDNQVIYIHYNINKTASFDTIHKGDMVEALEDNVLLVMKKTEQGEMILINCDSVRRVTIRRIFDCSPQRRN